MMFWLVAYVVFIGYAGTTFCYAVVRKRDGAALGILMTTVGAQLGLMQTLPLAIAVATGLFGLGLIAFETTASATRYLAPRLASRTIPADLARYENE